MLSRACWQAKAAEGGEHEYRVMAQFVHKVDSVTVEV
jgi:hypothetical protein